MALVIILGGALAYAAYTHFAASNPENSDMVPQPFIAVELEATHLTGNIAPGDTKSMSAVVKNPGSALGMAYIRFSYPVNSSAVGAAGSVYTWQVNSGWSVVEEGTGYTVYGYSNPIDGDGSTSSLMDSITMKNMSPADFKTLGNDVNVQLIGYVAECSEYGDEVQAAWKAAN